MWFCYIYIRLLIQPMVEYLTKLRTKLKYISVAFNNATVRWVSSSLENTTPVVDPGGTLNLDMQNVGSHKAVYWVHPIFL